MKKLVVVLAAIASPALAAAQQFTGSHKLDSLRAPEIFDNTDLFQDKFTRVGEDVFVAGQPTEKGLRELRDRGVKVIVSLRTPEEMRGIGFDEAAVASQLGMTYVNLPVRGNDKYPYSPQVVARFAQLLTNADGPVLLHCTIGWRASHLWAAYLIKFRGVPVERALANARAINLMDDHHMSDRLPVEDFLGAKLGAFKP